jgi:hypothetical protein
VRAETVLQQTWRLAGRSRTKSVGPVAAFRMFARMRFMKSSQPEIRVSLPAGFQASLRGEFEDEDVETPEPRSRARLHALPGLTTVDIATPFDPELRDQLVAAVAGRMAK